MQQYNVDVNRVLRILPHTSFVEFAQFTFTVTHRKSFSFDIGF